MASTLDIRDQFFVNNQISDDRFPAKLYYTGDETLLYHKRRASVIGSRNVSEMSRRRTRYITEMLIKHDIIIDAYSSLFY